jgi:hypothetical protein
LLAWLFPCPTLPRIAIEPYDKASPGHVNLNPLMPDRPYLSRAKLLRSDGSVRSRKSTDINPEEAGMAKGEQRSNRETKKPKKDKIKTIAAAPSQKGVGNLQSEFGSGKKK